MLKESWLYTKEGKLKYPYGLKLDHCTKKKYNIDCYGCYHCCTNKNGNCEGCPYCCNRNDNIECGKKCCIIIKE
jgi:hypothetical protein